ncbi:hypothetical protein EG68_09529 [Paragonimus skrjabini miyazakii]|uniref:Uncharacterized protein n=1 Tax=Paragonimus skrjabini miyazakii TaxID=59628 RepID=A0A8S9YHB8_9TREM|nr:hypothetical protein EG68_09529 [Paragonimus skrjabini miyazakii]
MRVSIGNSKFTDACIMLAGGLVRAKENSVHPSEAFTLPVTQYGSGESHRDSVTYFRAFRLSPVPSDRPGSCIAHAVDEEDSFFIDPPTEIGEPRVPIKYRAENSHLLFSGNWFRYSSDPDSDSPFGTVIWAPSMSESTAKLLQSSLTRQGNSSAESLDTETRLTASLLRNSNATEDRITSSIGTLYRRVSHPDYDQKDSHWISIYFDFNIGVENRLHMRVRRDVPLRWCSFVIANQLGLDGSKAHEQITFCYPTESTEIDQEKSSSELQLSENVVIRVQGGI